MKKILIIDDDVYICTLIENLLQQEGYHAETATTGKAGIKKIEKENFDVILCDFRLPDTDGMKMLKSIKKINRNTQVIIITAYSDVRMAVKLIKNGAFDYITKPIRPEEITERIEASLKASRDDITKDSFQKSFVRGRSKKIEKILEMAALVAPTDMTVHIEGETGSGKEYIARAIHYRSKRKDKPFVAVDCGAIPDEIANSELFGHIKGSFTGAIENKKGSFEIANGGTLFLDEIGNLSYDVQVKLLRVLQERVIYRVGENKEIKIDVRIIAATNEDLRNLVDENRFRVDLYHRINEFKIKIPPLRERKDDIIEFADHFLKSANKNLDKSITGFDPMVVRILQNYPWYGNLRELNNIVKRSALLTEGEVITPSCLPEEIVSSSGPARLQSRAPKTTGLKQASIEAEREIIINTLIDANYNKSKAAQMLNIDRKTLYNKIHQYNIELDK